MTVRPFRVGQRIRPNDLVGWVYSGLAGVPDAPAAVRRYRKGEWVLELTARSNVALAARVIAIRTKDEDDQWWSEKRRSSGARRR